MSSVTIAVDLAKHVFEVAVSTGAGRITERKRLSRSQLERFWVNRAPCRVVLEACASSHFWGRRLRALGFEVVLIPAQYARPYVRRSKTDRTDCEALLEAVRCAGIHPVAIRSEDQQAITALHRMRSQWMATRTARINAPRAPRVPRRPHTTAPVPALRAARRTPERARPAL
jgi:transposase